MSNLRQETITSKRGSIIKRLSILRMAELVSAKEFRTMYKQINSPDEENLMLVQAVITELEKELL